MRSLQTTSSMSMVNKTTSVYTRTEQRTKGSIFTHYIISSFVFPEFFVQFYFSRLFSASQAFGCAIDVHTVNYKEEKSIKRP